MLLPSFLGSSNAIAGGTPGRFDYWVLALSWSPQYCATAPRADARQCGSARPYGFVVHGLWPQYERGFPSDCSKAPYLAQNLVDRLLPLMPSKPLILHEWRKHGSCSGLDAAAYTAEIEAAYRSVRIPPQYRQLAAPLSLKPAALEATLIDSNPGLGADGIALECRGPYLSEVRICLDRQRRPRACGTDVRDRCGATLVLRPTRAAN